MTSNQESKRTMFILVSEFLKETDPAILAKMPNFSTQLTAFDLHLAEITRLSTVQGYNRKGYAKEKQEARVAVTELALDVAQKVRAYALNEGDSTLYEKMNLTRSFFERLRDTLVYDRVNFVILETTPILASLTTYDVTAAMLTELSDLMNAYYNLVVVPRQQISSRHEYTNLLGIAFKEADKNLNYMTKLVSMVEFSEPIFYRMFMHKRMIIDAGSRRISFLGTIFGEGSQLLEKVLVSIPSLKRSTYSTELGNFEFKHLPEGDHFVTFSRPGYFEHQAVVSITSTLQTKLDVTLKESSLKVA